MKIDLEKRLKRPETLRYIDLLVAEIYELPENFYELYLLMFIEDKDISWRAAWACDKISRKYPEWFNQEQISQIIQTAIATQHNGCRRLYLSILNNLDIKDNLPGTFINSCFEWMVSPRSEVSIQVLSMKFLYRLCTLEPALKSELLAHLENINPNDYSAGFNAAYKKIYLKLNRL